MDIGLPGRREESRIEKGNYFVSATPAHLQFEDSGQSSAFLMSSLAWVGWHADGTGVRIPGTGLVSPPVFIPASLMISCHSVPSPPTHGICSILTATSFSLLQEMITASG